MCGHSELEVCNVFGTSPSVKNTIEKTELFKVDFECKTPLGLWFFEFFDSKKMPSLWAFYRCWKNFHPTFSSVWTYWTGGLQSVWNFMPTNLSAVSSVTSEICRHFFFRKKFPTFDLHFPRNDDDDAEKCRLLTFIFREMTIFSYFPALLTWNPWHVPDNLEL